jgi:hypothetical protein
VTGGPKVLHGGIPALFQRKPGFFMLCAMEQWRRNFKQELEKAFTISNDESDEFFLATLVDHGDDEEAAGPSRRGGSVRGRRFVMRDREGWHHFRQAATVTILFPQFAPSDCLESTVCSRR